jgi:hypothetical protein
MTKSINVPEAGFGANQWNSFGGRNKIVVAYFAEAATKAVPATAKQRGFLSVR